MAGSFETIDLLLDERSTGTSSLSSELLQKFLFNNLRAGQWELASACLHTLFIQGGIDQEALVELLRNIIEEPFLYRY